MVTEAKGIRGRVCEGDTAHSILPHAFHLPSSCRQIKSLSEYKQQTTASIDWLPNPYWIWKTKDINGSKRTDWMNCFFTKALLNIKRRGHKFTSKRLIDWLVLKFQLTCISPAHLAAVEVKGQPIGQPQVALHKHLPVGSVHVSHLDLRGAAIPVRPVHSPTTITQKAWDWPITWYVHCTPNNFRLLSSFEVSLEVVLLVNFSTWDYWYRCGWYLPSLGADHNGSGIDQLLLKQPLSGGSVKPGDLNTVHFWVGPVHVARYPVDGETLGGF